MLSTDELRTLREIRQAIEGLEASSNKLKKDLRYILQSKFGDVPGGNYSEFESDGVLEFIGGARVYDDLPPLPILFTKPGSANVPTLSSFLGNTYQYSFNVGDYTYGNYEIVHMYDEGTSLNPHVHWATNGSEGSAKYVNWELEYTLVNGASSAPFSPFPATVTITTGDIEIPALTSDRSHFISGFGAISAASLKIGAYIVYRFRRVASVGAAPAAHPFGISLGFHYIKDTCGSRSLYTK